MDEHIHWILLTGLSWMRTSLIVTPKDVIFPCLTLQPVTMSYFALPQQNCRWLGHSAVAQKYLHGENVEAVLSGLSCL